MKLIRNEPESRGGAICDACGRYMREARSCTANTDVELGDGRTLPTVSYFDEDDRRCHDCGIHPGGFHHPMCDWERCPACGGQIITCGCVPSRLVEIVW